jgi:hypothetical protein
MSERRCMPSNVIFRAFGIRLVPRFDPRRTLRHHGEHAPTIGLELTGRIPLRATVIHTRVLTSPALKSHRHCAMTRDNLRWP